jgi:hypothetical protein
VVFGFKDDMTPVDPPSLGAGPYDQDTISGIVKRYLSPVFQVAVYGVTASATGQTYPVVWVPSHEAVPVCSTRDGPHDSKGKPIGIVQGTYYARAPGPESAPVTTPERWAPIIRRCILHERTALLAGLEPLLRAPGRPVAQSDDPLRVWHEAAYARFLELADADPDASRLKKAHYQLSYQIQTSDGQSLDMSSLIGHLRGMASEVLDLVDPGWTMFWIFDGPDIAPRSVSDPALGEAEFLECNLISSRVMEPMPDFWHISPNGLATLTRPYVEDRGRFGPEYQPGKLFWPYNMAREIAEVMRHARAFTERFDNPEAVAFRVEWRGLRGRELTDPENHFVRLRYAGRVAQSDSRLVTRTVAVADLASHWPEFTASMVSTVLRMFDATLSVSPDEVRAWSRKFRG